MHAARTLWSYMQKYLNIKEYNDTKMGYVYLTFLLIYGLGMNTVGPICCKYSLKGSISISCILVGVLFGCIAFLLENEYLTL